MKNWQLYLNYIGEPEIKTYVRKNCSGLWAVNETPDGVKLLYKLEDWTYKFTGFKSSSFIEIESYINNHYKNDIL